MQSESDASTAASQDGPNDMVFRRLAVLVVQTKEDCAALKLRVETLEEQSSSASSGPQTLLAESDDAAGDRVGLRAEMQSMAETNRDELRAEMQVGLKALEKTRRSELKADHDAWTLQLQDLNTKITTCTGTVESLKTELTIKIDTNDDAMKEKIQGLRQEVEEAEGKMTETRPAAQTQILSSADKAP